MELHRQSSSSGSPAKDERTAPSRSRNCLWCDQGVSDREGAQHLAPGRAVRCRWVENEERARDRERPRAAPRRQRVPDRRAAYFASSGEGVTA